VKHENDRRAVNKEAKAAKAWKNPNRYLIADPEWNDATGKKLGIDTTKPKRTILAI
jgi:hypothetical protein